MVQGTGPVCGLCRPFGHDNPLGATLVIRGSGQAQGPRMEPVAGVGLHPAVDCVLLGNFADECANIFCRAGSLNRSSIATHANTGANVGY